LQTDVSPVWLLPQPEADAITVKQEVRTMAAARRMRFAFALAMTALTQSVGLNGFLRSLGRRSIA
jgi:hypothetical protein